MRSPWSCTSTTAGWSIRAAERASRSKRARNAGSAASRGVHHLDRDGPVQPGVGTPVDGGHAAAGEHRARRGSRASSSAPVTGGGVHPDRRYRPRPVLPEHRGAVASCPLVTRTCQAPLSEAPLSDVVRPVRGRSEVAERGRVQCPSIPGAPVGPRRPAAVRPPRRRGRGARRLPRRTTPWSRACPGTITVLRDGGYSRRGHPALAVRRRRLAAGHARWRRCVRAATGRSSAAPRRWRSAGRTGPARSRARASTARSSPGSATAARCAVGHRRPGGAARRSRPSRSRRGSPGRG